MASRNPSGAPWFYLNVSGESTMPTASQRPALAGKGGASTASNETPVSTKEQPNPSSDPNTPASRPQNAAAENPAGVVNPKSAGPKPADKANGHDHPSESEHDHARQKLKGTSAERTHQTKH